MKKAILFSCLVLAGTMPAHAAPTPVVVPAIPTDGEAANQAVQAPAGTGTEGQQGAGQAAAQSAPPAPASSDVHVPDYALPPVNVFSNAVVPLDRKERLGVSLAEKWKNTPELPHRAEDGSVSYLYGATLPTLVCAPLQVCAIKLQPGETIGDVHAGDKVRWMISPAKSGDTTLVVIKPTDVALSTSLFITTDRRAYTIKLVSSRRSWMPMLSFDYPEDIAAEWAQFRTHAALTQQAAVAQTFARTLPTGEDVQKLDFGFKISGDAKAKWAPIRVYSDGVHTTLEFADGALRNDAPALVLLVKGDHTDTEMVNYRIKDNRYIVDKVIARAALILGVGKHQQRVEITHVGG